MNQDEVELWEYFMCVFVLLVLLNEFGICTRVILVSDVRMSLTLNFSEELAAPSIIEDSLKMTCYGSNWIVCDVG